MKEEHRESAKMPPQLAQRTAQALNRDKRTFYIPKEKLVGIEAAILLIYPLNPSGISEEDLRN
jgi:hypothetical protein